MPTHKVKGGYKWGKHGKVYPTKKQADKQGQAIYANGWKETNENKMNRINKNMAKITITENDLKQIIMESVKRILKENIKSLNFIEILNLDPITLTDEELKYVCRFLPTEVSEYNLSINGQQKFNSFYDEANKRFKQ